MIKILRYGSRHCLHFPGDYKMPQLNPISSRSHAERSHKRTHSFHEPLWLFRLRQWLFCFAGKQRCPDRLAGPEMLDTWDIGPDGNRTCSYCGSIHFEDLMTLCQKSISDPLYGVEGTTKGYKFYVRQPGVRNAGEGAIKYYTGHTPKDLTKDQKELFAQACRLTHIRDTERFSSIRSGSSASANS